jgi:hypothetical protein
MFIRYIGSKEGGLDKLKGKKVGLIYLDAPYGKEPIPLLEALAKDYGFELKLYPVPAAEMQNQSSQWLNIRRDRPDWIYIQGFGTMNPTAVKEAAKNNYPMDHLIGNWWAGSDDDARPAGEAAKGYLSLDFNQVGTNFPVIKDIQKYVVDKGKSQTAKDKVGENFTIGACSTRSSSRKESATRRRSPARSDYRRRHAPWSGNPEHHRCPVEGNRRRGFAAPMKVACEDHNGHNSAYGAVGRHQWTQGSDWIAPLKTKVRPLIDRRPRTTRRLMPAGRNALNRATSHPKRLKYPSPRHHGGERAFQRAMSAGTQTETTAPAKAADPFGQQYRSHLRPRHSGAQGRIARRAEGRDCRAARRQWRRQDHHPESHFQSAPRRAWGCHQRFNRV